jgi:hypothetical protein
MKSRLMLIAVLALGVFMAGTTTSLAAGGSAGSAQYAPEEESNFCEESGGVQQGHGCEYPCEENGSGAADGAYGSAEEAAENCEHQEVQPAASEPPAPTALPYTGLPLVPTLLVGLGLFGVGALMRLRLRSGDNFA